MGIGSSKNTYFNFDLLFQMWPQDAGKFRVWYDEKIEM